MDSALAEASKRAQGSDPIPKEQLPPPMPPEMIETDPATLPQPEVIITRSTFNPYPEKLQNLEPGPFHDLVKRARKNSGDEDTIQACQELAVHPEASEAVRTWAQLHEIILHSSAMRSRTAMNLAKDWLDQHPDHELAFNVRYVYTEMFTSTGLAPGTGPEPTPAETAAVCDALLEGGIPENLSGIQALKLLDRGYGRAAGFVNPRRGGTKDERLAYIEKGLECLEEGLALAERLAAESPNPHTRKEAARYLPNLEKSIASTKRSRDKAAASNWTLSESQAAP